MDSGRIEVKVAFPSGTHAVGKLLHALHLDAAGKAALDAHTLHIEIDGKENQGRLTDAHAFSVAPGEHRVVVWTSGLRATRVLTERSMNIVIEPAQTLGLTYLYQETSAQLTRAAV